MSITRCLLAALVADAATAADDATTTTAPCDARRLDAAKTSGCPSSRWQAIIAPSLKRDDEMIFVNAGANKGFNCVDFLQRYHPRSNSFTPPSASAWLDELVRFRPGLNSACGVCKACKAKDHGSTTSAAVASRKQHQAAARRVGGRVVRVFALEMLPANVEILRHQFETFRIPGEVIHAAVTQHSSHALVRSASEDVGKEDISIRARSSSASSSSSAAAASQQINTTTIDALASRRAIRHIDLLSIDVEGWDALVIEGARGLLKSKRVSVLEFEYHGVGMWSAHRRGHRNLKTTVATLYGYGYRCFWQASSAHNGTLIPMNGPGEWCDGYEFRSWSNVVCAAQEGILASMRTLVPEASGWRSQGV